MLDIAQNVRIDRLAACAPGERPAVVSADGTLCYAEFDAAVNHIAKVLHAKGVERDECVGVIVPRSSGCSSRSMESCARAPRTCRSTRDIRRYVFVRSSKRAVPGLSWPEPNSQKWLMNSVLIASSRA